MFEFLFRGLKVFLFQIELDQADPGIEVPGIDFQGFVEPETGFLQISALLFHLPDPQKNDAVGVMQFEGFQQGKSFLKLASGEPVFEQQVGQFQIVRNLFLCADKDMLDPVEVEFLPVEIEQPKQHRHVIRSLFQ